MAAFRGPRLQVGSASWITEERSAAFQIVQQESEEFSYSARNELDWLNEHMASIFDENAVNFAEAFKTPGKLRRKTPRTVGKSGTGEARVPLSDVFAATPNGSTRRNGYTLNQKLSPYLKARVSKASPSSLKVNSPRRQRLSPKPAAQSTQDSGYYGSQDIGSTQPNNIATSEDIHESVLNQASSQGTNVFSAAQSSPRDLATHSPTRTFQTDKEEQTTRAVYDLPLQDQHDVVDPMDTHEQEDAVNDHESLDGESSSPVLLSPEQLQSAPAEIVDDEKDTADAEELPSEDARSPSEGSSPIRGMVRKSSLNFASLPAREPLVGGKSIGNRVSRTSHLEYHRMSYYNRPTEIKSATLGGKHEDLPADAAQAETVEQDSQKTSEDTEDVALHTKTYTQRLQAQISMLGQSQATNARQSKSIPSSVVSQPLPTSAPPVPAAPVSSSPKREATTTTPGAFPEDPDDDWIDPPPRVSDTKDARPPFPKSLSADVMENIRGKSTVGADLLVTDIRQTQSQEPVGTNDAIPNRLPSALGHKKAASQSAALIMPRADPDMGPPLTKAMTVSNPTRDVITDLPDSELSPGSKFRTFRDSPLKQVKNKFSSVLKASKNLLVQGAALSAEGKSAMMSPSSGRLGFFPSPSRESVVTKTSNMESPRSRPVTQPTEPPSSPTRRVLPRTRASSEREREDKRREKEAKLIAEQNEKLEKAREKEREKARVFSKEQETSQAETQAGPKNDQEGHAVKETPKPTRKSPRKGKTTGEGVGAAAEKDVDAPDASSMMPPPSVPRSTGPSRSKDIKRLVKPTKEPYGRPKQAPTVIKVNTGSQHSQLNSSMSASTSAGTPASQSQHQLSSKASKAPLQKSGPTSFKSSLSSASRLRGVESASKKKEQDDRDAQRRRDAKLDIERKRAAAQEEHRKQDQQKRQEAEAQRQKELELAEARKLAQRQAAIEKAKQTRAPPPAVRPQPSSSSDLNAPQDRPQSALANQKSESQPVRPHSRMTSGIHRPYDEPSRPVNAVLNASTKATMKRPLGADGEEGLNKRPPSRGGPSYHTAEAKRRRTSNEFEDAVETSYAPNIKGPPVRPSSAFKKDLPTKPIFPNGYSNAPQSATRDLFKATVAVNSNLGKAATPLDLAPISRGGIPFAPNPNAAGPSYKTPARPGPFKGVKSAAKSVTRSSPRFQNGESIELPEIDTDEEDDDEPSHGMRLPSWAASPNLFPALQNQEGIDPQAVFGHPEPLNMEEVFNNRKDRFHKFRMRTSSANWSGADKLTEDDIRKDMAARDRLRREGGWSYEMSKDVA